MDFVDFIFRGRSKWKCKCFLLEADTVYTPATMLEDNYLQNGEPLLEFIKDEWRTQFIWSFLKPV